MATSGDNLRRVVVGVDGSPSSAEALKWAARQAALTNSVLEVVTTWHWPMSFGYPMPLPADFLPGVEAGKVLEEAVASVRGDHPDLQIVPHLAEDNAAQALVSASKGAELLVVGSRGHHEVAGFLLGSVSQYCVANGHCPVLVFRS